MGEPAQDRDAVALTLGISPRTLRRLERTHGIPVLRVGRQVRYDRLAIAALEEACRSKSAPVEVVKVYGSPAPLPLPARRKGSASADVLAAMMQDLQQKKRPRLSGRSCETTTTENVVAFVAGQKP
jgi:hypothetical protein